MTAAKGLVCNDNRAASVAQLNPDWVHVQFGATAWDTTNVLAHDWVLALYDYIPTADEVAKAIQHPNYGGQWMVGHNEPDLSEGWTPLEQYTLISAQIAAVLKVDPTARFAVEGGSQYHPIWSVTPQGNPNSYFWKVWKKMTPTEQAAVRALHFHYYVQAEIFPPLDLNLIWSPDPIIAYFTKVKAGMAMLNVDTKRLWVTEIGLAETAYTLANMDKVAQYPSVIQQAMDVVGAARWAYYIQKYRNDGYHALQDANGLTGTGQTFAGLVTRK